MEGHVSPVNSSILDKQIDENAVFKSDNKLSEGNVETIPINTQKTFVKRNSKPNIKDLESEMSQNPSAVRHRHFSHNTSSFLQEEPHQTQTTVSSAIDLLWQRRPAHGGESYGGS